ncbi:hypothetical protein [Azohydromonas australica]|uniref:hypothetical protein n=1 Tax=Azohydromonas australica TaxID=364039 RepID=UPI000417CDF1|nr:hypothetical protein [Azohydromonas australica]
MFAFARAGKPDVPRILFSHNTEPSVINKAPHDWVTLRPRRIELEHVERLRAIDRCRMVCSPEELEAELSRRLQELSLE